MLRTFAISIIATIFSCVLSFSFVSVIIEKHHTAITYNGAGADGKQTSEDKPEKGFWHVLFHDPTAFFTGILAIFTIVLAFATIALIIITRRGIREQADLTRASLSHAETGANAAKQAADIAEATSIVNSRAWIKVTGVSFSGALQSDRDQAGILARPQFINVGNSIAQNIGYSLWLLVEPWSWNQETSLFAVHRAECEVRTRIQGSIYLYPGETYPTHGDAGHTVITTLQGMMRRALIDNQQTVSIFVGGIVTYNFPSDPETVHRTTFHYSIRGPNGWARTPIEGNQANVVLGNLSCMGPQLKRLID